MNEKDMNEEHYKNNQQLGEDEYENAPYSRWHRIFFVITSLIIGAMLVWTYQVQPYFIYRETPVINVAPIERAGTLSEDRETITVPIRIIVARGGSNSGSLRDMQNINQLSENAEAIWNQAGVNFSISSIDEVTFSDKEIDEMFDDPSGFWTEQRGPNDDSVIVVLARTLRGSNGIAWPELRGFAVADITSVPDYRAYAHEIGHLMGLKHSEGSRARLMYQGANGSGLDAEEIISTREFASSVWGF